jgi:hypothetical protein
MKETPFLNLFQITIVDHNNMYVLCHVQLFRYDDPVSENRYISLKFVRELRVVARP